MAMDLKEIESLIKEALSDATVEIQDLGWNPFANNQPPKLKCL